MKKIWLCGSSGMLGSHVKRLLVKRGEDFVATDRDRVDITDMKEVLGFVRSGNITHILNCAAYTNVDQAELEQKAAYLINAVGPHHLGLAGRQYGAKVLHFSTDYVFDGKSSDPYEENHACSPLGAYGISKLAGEFKLLDENPHACIIRTSWLFGYPGKNFVETMLRLMEDQKEVRVVSDQVGRPTYCGDLAEAAFDLLEQEGLFHYANTLETSWYDYAREIHRQAKQMGLPLKVEAIEPISSQEYPTAAKRPVYSTLCTRKVEKVLGRKPRPWQDALSDYLSLRKTTQCTAT